MVQRLEILLYKLYTNSPIDINELKELIHIMFESKGITVKKESIDLFIQFHYKYNGLLESIYEQTLDPRIRFFISIPDILGVIVSEISSVYSITKIIDKNNQIIKVQVK